MDQLSSKGSTIRFLSFNDDEEDAEKKVKLKEAASKIEQAIARDRSLNELIDYVPPLSCLIKDPKDDTRPLYERLQEQKNKKQEALEESQKLSNLVTTLDADDANYLNELAKNKQEDELKKRLEVYDALEERKRIKEKLELDEEKKKKDHLLGINSRSKLPPGTKLSRLIKIKPKMKTTETSKPSSNSREETTSTVIHKRQKTLNEVEPDKKKLLQEEKKLTNGEIISECNCNKSRVMSCIGVLPSLPIVERLNDSDDSDKSNDDLNQEFISRVLRRHHK